MAQRPTISPSDVILSCAQPADLDAIIEIEEAAFPTPWSRTALNAYIGDHGFVVCEYEEKLVGYILVGPQIPSLFDRLERLTMGWLGNEKTETVGHVMNIALHQDYRGYGLGRYLLQTGLNYLKSIGVTRVELEVRINNHNAIGLYESEGFETVNLLKGYYQNGDDAFLMNKRFL